MPSAPPLEQSTTETFRRGRRGPRLQEAGLVGVILLIGVVLALFGKPVMVGGHLQNNFLRPSNLLGGVATPMSMVAIMAVGMTFVIISGGIDISVGSVFAVSALAAAAVLQELPRDASGVTSIGLAALVAGGVGLLCGLVNGALVVLLRMHPFIVTLGTMSIFRGIANVSVRIKTLPGPGRVLPRSFTTDFMMWEPRPWLQPVPVVIMLACAAVGWVVLSYTVWGRQTYAVGGNEEAARFSGIPVGWAKLRVYAIAGLAAGIAGMVSLGYYGSASTNTGTGYELMVIAAAVVGGASLTGGRGTALGALLGALVIKLIENAIFILNLNQEYSSIIIGAAIIVAVAVDRVGETLRQKRLARAKSV